MNILLADDSPEIRTSLGEFLSELGHHVRSCGDGLEAWNILTKEAPDLVLTDIRMPVMDGHELLRRIRENTALADVEVILFTGHGDIKGAVDAMQHGAYDYLLKPVNVRELHAILQKLNAYLSLKQEYMKLTRTFRKEVREATREAESELAELRRAFAREVGTADIGVFSPVMEHVLETARRLHLNRDVPVLIEGETGTGKEVVARYIHYGDGNTTTPFVALNCAAISSSLFESELFGYEKGAFTGGNPRGQAGKIESAGKGTVFLDEITEMPVEQQAKLLRVLQEREYYRVGSSASRSTEARFICATNRDVRDEVTAGRLREDLFYRLNVGFIHIPPLRERREAVLPLARMFLLELAERKPTRFRDIHPDAAEMLEGYAWPGNVRELKNTIERVVLHFDDDIVLPAHLAFLSNPSGTHGEGSGSSDEPDLKAGGFRLPERGFPLKPFTLEIVRKALDRHEGNQTRTAHYLGLSVRELHTYMKKLRQNTDE